MATLGGGIPADGPVFNAWFLGALIGSGVLSMFSLLYFNRVFASIVSWALRTWTWHQYRIYIDIQAIQISLLAGRIFFTGLRYHGNNETVLVQHGHITWSYWLRRVRKVNTTRGKKEKAEGDGDGEDTAKKLELSAKLPCRINVSISGLEWFVYNRSPAYDSVLAGLTEPWEVADEAVSTPMAEPDDSTSSKPRRRQSRRFGTSGDHPPSDHVSGPFGEKKAVPVSTSTVHVRAASLQSDDSEDGDGPSENTHTPDDGLPIFLQLLPIHLVCDRAAMVMGNENTKAILIVKAESMTGEVDASETKTPDPYRQFFRFQFKHPVIEMKENQDFKEDQAVRATRDKQTAQGSIPLPTHSSFGQLRRKVFVFVQKITFYWKVAPETSSAGSGRGIDTAASHLSGSARWQGLSRYLYDEGDDQKARWASSEYAAVPTILDSPEASLSIFWDVVSKVRDPSENSRGKLLPLECVSNINGDEPPAWAIHLSVKGGSINYGPWADRQRADLQRIFVPSLCRDAVPAPRLRPGAYRVPTQFKLYVELEECVTMRIPLREESKNWKWKGKEPVPKPPRGAGTDGRKARGRSKKSDPPVMVHQRPYGWLDIKVGANTTLSYSMDMVAGASGYSVALDLDVPSTEISSSVNHELLWRSGRQSISCDLSTPLGWNSLRQWHFSIASRDLELFLLRDHVFLLTDLVDDWATGPPAEYLVFTPFKYHINLQFENMRLFLNLNDANIVDNPTELEDNTNIIFASPLLESNVCIPIDVFRPSKNEIPFKIRAETASIDLHVPPWNTQASFLDSPEIASMENLVVDGTYQYNSTASPSNTDTLLLNVTGQSPTVYLYGFIVRYFLKIKDNYFGDDIHFKTLEEYQEMLRLKESNPEAESANKAPAKKSNDLDVMLSLRADDPKILLPANLYSCRRHVQIDTACIALDLRFTNYYMELELAIAPLNLSLGNRESGAETPISITTSTQLFIDGVSIYGHRLFGLPPSEPTYMCNWDISAGAVSGECTAEFLSTLIKAGSAFGFCFDDDENALIPASSIVLYDVTFLRAAVQSVCLWVHIEEAAFLLSTGAISANYNDWARSHYSKRADVKIPDIKLSCVNAESATRHKLRPQQQIQTDALVETSLCLSIIGRKVNFSSERKLQQELVRREDQRTHRAHFLTFPEFMHDAAPDLVDAPAQSIPPIPLPTRVKESETGHDGKSLSSMRSSMRSRSLRNKSSFLSLASSHQSSVLRPHSTRPPSARHRVNLTRLKQHSGMHAREFSASTRHSAFYSASGERHGPHADRQDVFHNTVAFSSQYFAPYFPLDSTVINYKEAMMPSIERDDDERSETVSASFDLGDVDSDSLGEDCAYTSILLEMPLGLTAFCNPTSLRYVVALMSALQPSDAHDILDSLQIDSMKDIFSMQKEQKMKGRISDLLVRIPRANVRFINSSCFSPLESLEPAAEEQDQYDVSITKLALTCRSETRWEDSFKPDFKVARHSFHLRLKSMELTAAEIFSDMDTSQAAVLGQIENVTVSMGNRDVTYLDVDVGNIQSSTSSEKIDYLASLIHRTGLLASDLGKLFSDTSWQEKSATRRLVRRLVGNGHDAPDPAFLVRPSAVLRSAHQHLRTFDSWKLIMRLRQMWTIQNPSEKEDIQYDCLGRTEDLPTGLRQEVTAAFEKWRSWDLDNLSESVLLNGIFGPPVHLSKPDSAKTKILAVVRIRQVGFVLDPGPKQNEVTVLDLTARCETKPQLAEDRGRLEGAEVVDEADGRFTVVNIYCGDAALNLNWELCELAAGILKLANRMQSKPPAQSRPDKAATKKPQAQAHTIHCVLSLGRGSIGLEAINLHASSFSDGMKASVLLRTGSESDNLMDANFILSCDSVTSTLRSHSQGIAKLVVEKPSVFISHELQATHSKDYHTIKSTASSRYLSLIVKQDPINIAEVVDLVVRDEIAQLYRLHRLIPSPTRTTTGSTNKIADRLSAFRVNVAMFMDEYTISVPLLRTLTYTVNGTVARIAMAADFGTEIILDFDIKENSHEMQTKVNEVSRSISLLQIPPTNGRVRSRMDLGEHSISVFASVELVQLDASAVYSLLSALNRPEISNAINELQHQTKVIQEHSREILGGGEQQPEVAASGTLQETSKSAKLAYDIHLTFAGLEVFGNSPLESKAAPLAHISFALDNIHLGVSNRLEQNGRILDFPETHVNLRHIAFEIQRGAAGAMSSCGNLGFGAIITASSRPCEDGEERKFFNVKSDAFEVNLSPDTVSTVVDVLGYMGDKIKDLDTSRELEYLRKLRQSKPRIAAVSDAKQEEEADIIDAFLSSITYTLEICNIQIAWLVNTACSNQDSEPGDDKADLVLSLQRIEFGTRTRNSARLTIENLQLQMISALQEKRLRSPNSALLPEVIFNIAYVSTSDARRLAFQAVGKSLDIRLTSGFIIPAAGLNESITLSIQNAQHASQNWNPVVSSPAPAASASEQPNEARKGGLLGSRRLESLLVDADFAGAVVHLAAKKAASAVDDQVSTPGTTRSSLPGKYGQFGQEDATTNTALRSPGLALKMEYRDNGREDPSLYAEVKIDASSNILYPSVVPLIMDISNSVKAVVSRHDDEDKHPPPQPQGQATEAEVKAADEDTILTADPTAVLGRMKLNLGLRICKQEFSLSCQPIARVAATASFEDVYFTVHTVRSMEQGNFFAISGTFSTLQASIQHVYSRESTGSFTIQTIVLSLMNSKHVSGTSGVSAILKVSPMEISINAKQLQDFMLFREIWLPRDVKNEAPTPVAKLVTETSQGHLVQRYQQVAATAAFPWTATISIEALKIVVDLGQALGKSTFSITEFWVSSKKTSDWEQNLCLGFDMIGVESTGRMSGFVALQNFKLRTSIQWPEREQALNETPMIQASVGFSQFRVKAAFDYQAFLVADITSLEFLMYNVRRSREGTGDRLVAIFDGEAVQIFGTTSSAAQGVALYQAFQKLIQERKANFETSLKEIEKYMKRKSVSAPAAVIHRLSLVKTPQDEALLKSPISLDTDVVVTLQKLNLGVFPSTFSDHQVFKMEALNAQARFAASIEDRRIHSVLGLTLGQLRIGLAGVRIAGAPKTLSELSVEDVVQSATGSRGGTILKVPRVEAVMQTWQAPDSRQIDYIFKSAFEGKVEVGWNYSRISFIRGMWANHAKALARVSGREMAPVTAIRVTGVPESPDDQKKDSAPSAAAAPEPTTAENREPHQQQQTNKITAEVKVPQSKYEYTALEPAIIETPQLRDMGEATPPLEWIGLNRERLPNLTHQIVIVSLLELAGEVEDAYSSILGST